MTGLRVVIADDQPMMRAGFKAVLEATGSIEVVADAATGEEAVAAAEAHRPDVVLMDIGMPGMSGHEVASELRRRRPGSEPLIVAVTGWGKPEDRARAREAGVDVHLVKPVEEEDLREVLGRTSIH